jgi:hypothetical protein
MNFTQSQLDAAYDASCMTTIDLQAYLGELLKISGNQIASFTELYSLLIAIVFELKSDFPFNERMGLLLAVVQYEITSESKLNKRLKSGEKDGVISDESISHAKNEGGQ